MNKIVSLLIIMVFCCGCSSNPTEKYQNKRNNIVNVHDRIKEIVIDDVLINNLSEVLIIDDNYLFIKDQKSMNEFIHVFNKDDFRYITSTVFKGQGPGEITRMGHVAEDKTNRKFYVTDRGKRKIFSYDIDSVITDPGYLPVEKMKINKQQLPMEYTYINDTLSIGTFMLPIGSNDFNLAVGKFNMKTGETNFMSYSINPNVKEKRTFSDVSVEYGIYVEAYMYYDLLTICDIDGNLKYNIYGPEWSTETRGMNYFGSVQFCNNRIIVPYSGDKTFKDAKFIYPTKLMIFDLEGNYLKTLETGYKIQYFCFDKENQRLIITFNDELQFAYLDLDELLD